MSPAITVDRAFSEEVLFEERPVLVACRASWCVPSLDLEPTLDELADEYDGRAKVVRVDVGDDLRSNAVCRRYGITRLPVLMLFDRGHRRDMIGGMTSKASIAAMVDARLKPVLEVGERDFEVDVLRSRMPVLVHFHAAWCAASLDLLPLVESVGERFRGRARVVQVDFDGNRALCARYAISRVPVLALFDQGRLRDQILGAMTGGTKDEGRATSCVNLTSFDNVGGMLEEFIL
jgi:thioredoxin 1